MKTNKWTKIFFIMICLSITWVYFDRSVDFEVRNIVEVKKNIGPAKGTTANITPSVISPESREPASTPKKIDEMDKYKLINREKTKEAYLEMINYPETSSPINPEKSVDYQKNKFSPDIKEVLGSIDSSVVMNSWTDKNYYILKDKVIHLYVLLRKKGKNIDPEFLTAKLDNRMEITFVKNSKGEYIGELDTQMVGIGSHMIVVSSKLLSEELTQVNGFKVDDQYARYEKLKRSYLDQDGNLIFEHQVNVLKRGAYLVQGILYSDSGKMVASAQSTAFLDTGSQTMNLNFYGYIFYKQKIGGRFNLKNIELSFVSEDLATHGEQLITLNAFTENFEWDQFNSLPYNNGVVDSKLALVK